jgi:hypothetical protein
LFDWLEMEATFEKPYATVASWATEWTGGSNYAANPTAVTTVNYQNRWYSWDVTSDVKAFLSGAPNYGWFLKSAEGGPSDITSAAFYSKDAKEFRPYLEITLSGNQP